MTAVLAQMRSDAVGAGSDGDLGRLDRIGMMPAARIAHGGDVVDVDAEADGRSGHKILPPGYLAQFSIFRSGTR